jgi:hypothetical protein
VSGAEVGEFWDAPERQVATYDFFMLFVLVLLR